MINLTERLMVSFIGCNDYETCMIINHNYTENAVNFSFINVYFFQSKKKAEILLSHRNVDDLLAGYSVRFRGQDWYLEETI